MVYGGILDGSLLLLGSLYVNIWFIDMFGDTLTV
jgi:hypothetical protein